MLRAVSANSIEGQGEASQDPAVIPFTAPIHDHLGRLTYLGSDGRRYVVADPPPGNGAQDPDDHNPPA
jgi:hypothetical protein